MRQLRQYISSRIERAERAARVYNVCTHKFKNRMLQTSGRNIHHIYARVPEAKPLNSQQSHTNPPPTPTPPFPQPHPPLLRRHSSIILLPIRPQLRNQRIVPRRIRINLRIRNLTRNGKRGRWGREEQVPLDQILRLFPHLHGQLAFQDLEALRDGEVVGSGALLGEGEGANGEFAGGLGTGGEGRDDSVAGGVEVFGAVVAADEVGVDGIAWEGLAWFAPRGEAV